MMKINEKKFNFWFSLALLAGMIAVAVFNFIYKIDDPDVKIAMQIISSVGAIMGVTNTVLSANGSIWTFLFGFLDVVCCTITYYDSGIMGTFALHAFYFLPMQFIGFWQWRKRGAGRKAEDGSTTRVHARRLTKKQWGWLGAAIVVGTGVAFAILHGVDLAKYRAGTISEINDSKVLLDALVLICNIIGQILMSLAFTDQWYVWILVNVFSIMLWISKLFGLESSSYAVVMVLKYFFYLLNSLNGIRIWLQLSREKPSGSSPTATSERAERQ